MLGNQVPSIAEDYARYAGASEFPGLWRGLVGAWMPSLGKTGTRLFDVSGQGHHTTLALMVPREDWIPTEDGTALDFDGFNDHTLTTPTPLLQLTSFTFLATVRRPSQASFRRILSYGDGASDPNRYSMLLNGATFGYQINNTGHINQSATTVPNNEWTHLVWRVDQQSDLINFFINGRKDSNSYSASLPSYSAVNPFFIGRDSTGTSQFWAGGIRDILAYDRPIADSEISQLFRMRRAPFQLRARRGGRVAGVTVTVSGTTTTGIDEDDMTGAPAETTILTLTGDTWVAAGATFDAQRAAIRDGVSNLLPVTPELTGWNTEVRDTALVGAVVRDNDTQVTITWATAQTTSYDITAQETIEVTVPPSALVTSLISVVGTPTFTVDAVGVAFSVGAVRTNMGSGFLGI